MSDAELFRSEPETSNMPIVLASVISLALHGLLWTLPPISMSKQKADNNLNVGLVQLTPEEVSRLQEFSDPALSLPPLPPTLPSANVLPPLPPPQQQSSTQSLQQQEELVRQQIVQRQQALLQRQLQQQEEVLRQQIRRNQEFIQQQKLKQQEELQRQVEQDKKRLQREFEQKQAKLQRQQEQENNRRRQLQRDIEEQDERQQALIRQQNKELLRQWQQKKVWDDVVDKELKRQQVLEARRLAYNYSADNTTEEKALENLTAARAQFMPLAGDQHNLDQEIIKLNDITSPIKLKLPDVTPAGVAFVIDDKGRISSDLQLTRSAGYPQLNDAAKKAAMDNVKQCSLPKANKKKICHYEINFEQINEDSP